MWVIGLQELDSVKKTTFLLGFALVKEKGGFAFISTVKLHFSLVFWVRNAWKMWFSRYRSKIKHFSLVSNPKYAGKVNFTVSKNKPTHFLHLCGNPSKKIVISLWKNVICTYLHLLPYPNRKSIYYDN